MAEQVFDLDLRALLGRILRQDLGDLLVEPQLALLGELEDGDGGELLGDRADPEDHVGLDRHSQLDAGEPAALGAAELSSPRASSMAAPGTSGG